MYLKRGYLCLKVPPKKTLGPKYIVTRHLDPEGKPSMSLLREMNVAVPNPKHYISIYFEHPHPLLVEILWGWALWGHSGVGHETLRLGTDSGDTLGLGTPGRLWGWALQGDSGARHSREL